MEVRGVSRPDRRGSARAIRADKTCLAGMAETLRHYARGEATEEIPVWRMISADSGALRRRAERVVGLLQAAGCNGHVAETVATIGGGALPGETMPSWAIVLDPGDGANVDDLARRMRTGGHSIFPRIDHQHLVCDLRTVLPEDDDRLFEGILHAAACNG